MSKRNSDALSSDIDAELKMLEGRFPRRFLGGDQKLTVHFQHAWEVEWFMDEDRVQHPRYDNLALRIEEEFFIFKKEEFKTRSLALLKAVAVHFYNITELELANSISTWAREHSPQLMEAIMVLGDAGKWTISMKYLHLKFWTLGCCASFSESLSTLPSNLVGLIYEAGNNDNLSSCAHHLNKFTKRLHHLQTLHFSSCYAHDYDNPFPLGKLLEGLDKECPKLAKISIASVQKTPISVEEAYYVHNILSNLRCSYEEINARVLLSSGQCQTQCLM